MDHDISVSDGSAGRPRKIAVLDDSNEVLGLLNMLLTDEGYDVELLNTTIGALKRIKELKPSLVMLDLMLHGQHGGWHVVQELKIDEETRDIPTIILTGASLLLKAHSEEISQLGCYVQAKPFEIDELTRTVQVALSASPQPLWNAL